jgi:hypothetical protein
VNIEELEIELNKLGVPKNYYSINGHLRANTYMLNKVYSKWEYFCFDEKGNKLGYRTFEDENDACQYLLKKLKMEMEYRKS